MTPAPCDRAGNIIAGEGVPPTAGLAADRAGNIIAGEGVPRNAGFAAPLPPTPVPTQIIHVIDDLGLGGAQRQLVELLRGLAPLGYEQQVVSLSRTKNDYAQTIRQMNIPLTLIPHVGMWSWETLGRLSELFHQMRPTVVHTWLFTADLYGRLAAHFSNVPIVISTVRSVEPDKPRHYVWADRVLKRWTHHFIANAEAVGEVLFQREGVAREKISVIRNGVDTQHFSPQPSDDILRTHLGALPEQPLIAIVGRLAPVKDHATFLRAAALVLRQLPTCRFAVIGNGPLKASLQQWVQRKDMEHAVKFAEGRSDMSPIYAACDVIVVSSRYEGCSNVILEAMAMGKPVVATAVGGNPELVVEAQTGYLVPAGAPEALAEAVAKLVREPALARTLGENGRRRAEEHFNQARMVEQTDALYQELLKAVTSER